MSDTKKEIKLSVKPKSGTTGGTTGGGNNFDWFSGKNDLPLSLLSPAILGGANVMNLGAHNNFGDGLNALAGVAGAIPGYGWLISAGLSLAGGVANGFTDLVNDGYKDIKNKQIADFANVTSSARDTGSLLQDFRTLGNLNISLGDLDLWGSVGAFVSDSNSERTKARNQALGNLLAAKLQRLVNLGVAADNINQGNYMRNLENLTAFGGLLSSFNTSLDTSGNKALNKYNGFVPLTTFADGGLLHVNGGLFDNGLLYINEGGTHELNPYDGVLLGVDPNNIPNLVEEGEVVWNNYVFSDRIKVPKELLKKYKLGGEVSFAKAVKKLSAESEERPLDLITKESLDTYLIDMAMQQENIRMGEGKVNYANEGGPLLNKFLYGSWMKKNHPDVKKGTEDWDKYREDYHNFRNALIGNTMTYAPAIGSGLTVLSDLFGITNNPDYSAAEAALDSVRDLRTVSASPVGSHIGFTPFDSYTPVNRMLANLAAQRSAILNSTNANVGANLAGLALANYQGNTALGDLLTNIGKENFARRLQTALFNNSVDLFNAQQSLEALRANMANNSLIADARLKAGLYLYNSKESAEAARAANMTSFLDNLGAIGKNYNEDAMIEALRRSGFTLTPPTEKKCGGLLKKRK